MKYKIIVLLASIFVVACSGENENNNNVKNTTNTLVKKNNKTTPKTHSSHSSQTTHRKTNKGTTHGMTTMNCSDVKVFTEDMDGDKIAAIGSASEMKCLKKSELADYALKDTDCNDHDPTQFPGAEGICGDHVVDTCEGPDPLMVGGAICQKEDEACPETKAGTIDDPTWNCEGAPPSNVYAFATFPNDNAYFKDGACFVFFEGFKDGFYVKHNMERKKTDKSCATARGCVCPVAEGKTSYDRRMYAFTTDAKLMKGDIERNADFVKK